MFKGVEDVVILCIDRDKVTCEVIDEDLSNLNDLYPHVYGVINTDAVVEVLRFEIDSLGEYGLPDTLLDSQI